MPRGSHSLACTDHGKRVAEGQAPSSFAFRPFARGRSRSPCGCRTSTQSSPQRIFKESSANPIDQTAGSHTTLGVGCFLPRFLVSTGCPGWAACSYVGRTDTRGHGHLQLAIVGGGQGQGCIGRKKGGKRGCVTQKFVHPKWCDQIFPMVNFIVFHDGHFGLEGGLPLLWCTAVLLLPLAGANLFAVPNSEIHGSKRVRSDRTGIAGHDPCLTGDADVPCAGVSGLALCMSGTLGDGTSAAHGSSHRYQWMSHQSC